MANPDLGQKFLCAECGAKFYDLGKKPPTCPACETVHVPVGPPKPRRASAAARKPPAPVVAPMPAEPEQALEEGETPKGETATVDEAGDDVIEDTSELSEDDEDVASVVTKGDKGD